MSSQVTGYRRLDAYTGEQLGVHDLDLPPGQLETRAFWYVVPDEVLTDAGLTAATLPGALHAAEHAAIGILPLFTICDRWDVGGVSTPFLPETGAATIVIYDGYPGGAGIAELGYDAGDRHLAATLEVIEQCACARWLPVVRPVTQVRQRQRPAGQGRRHRPAAPDPRALTVTGHGLRVVPLA